MFSSEELKRYNRHLILPGFGREGQEKLKSARVLVIGAGGLGCPVLQYLAAAGVGTIGIIDFDVVDESNLQRQVLYSVSDIGKSKAETAAHKLIALNPNITVNTHNTRLDKDNALKIFRNYDVVIDGSDNFTTRYLVNDACVMLGLPLVAGSIFKFEGQVSVFNLSDEKGEKGPTYRCLFPEAPGQGEVPGCSEIGVLGVLPGLIGTIQANEAIKIIAGIGETLSGTLLIVDALNMQFTSVKVSAVPDNQNITQLEELDLTCSTPENEVYSSSSASEISPSDLKEWIASGKKIQLIDVREPFEHQICSLGGTLIPMNTIQEHVEKISVDLPVVIYCHHGVRSAMVVKFLSEHFGYKNLHNLEGGIHAWAREIDPDMATY